MVNADAKDVIEAEKGNSLTPKNLHLRLRVVEAVLLASLLLNIAHWIVAGTVRSSRFCSRRATLLR